MSISPVQRFATIPTWIYFSVLKIVILPSKSIYMNENFFSKCVFESFCHVTMDRRKLFFYPSVFA